MAVNAIDHQRDAVNALAAARSDRYTGVPMTQGSAGHHIHQKKGNAT